MANRRPVEWQGFAMGSVTPGERSIVTESFLAENYTAPTVIRLVGSLIIRHGTPGTNTDTGDYSIHRLGIFVGRSTVSLANSGNLSEPWLWVHTDATHAPHYFTSIGNAAGLQIAKGVGRRDALIHFDIRAMRKIRKGEGILFRWDHDPVADEGQSPTLHGHVRALLKE